MPVNGCRPCGAKCRTKSGAPCLQPAMRDSNRCRMHFGHARKLRTHGRLSIFAEEERRQQREFLREMKAMNSEIQSANDDKFHGS